MAWVDCSNLARSSSPSFPYYRDWNFGVDSNQKPKKDLNKPLIIAAKTNMEVLLEVVEEEAKLVVAKPQRQ
ncbi:unnamed protein product [Brassica napus]|uniref:Uncharacterized protein n=2 Tax=Brassica TaxID=3705 RepID=M4EKV3_BRACM|nr:unnamed protein product [Brassica napus]